MLGRPRSMPQRVDVATIDDGTRSMALAIGSGWRRSAVTEDISEAADGELNAERVGVREVVRRKMPSITDSPLT